MHLFEEAIKGERHGGRRPLVHPAAILKVQLPEPIETLQQPNRRPAKGTLAIVQHDSTPHRWILRSTFVCPSPSL
jgi:hypothetical protein